MADRPILFSAPMVRALLAGTKTQTRRVVKGWRTADGSDDFAPPVSRCPYGQPGDRLWVRETWTTHAFLDDIPPRDLTTRSLHYQADGVIKTGKLRPSIHMPRWASRITLEITAVRVERLQEISEADAKAEGAPGYEEGVDIPPPDDGYEWSYYAAFPRLWESINGPGSWLANPWVWVIEFSRVKP